VQVILFELFHSKFPAELFERWLFLLLFDLGTWLNAAPDETLALIGLTSWGWAAPARGGEALGATSLLRSGEQIQGTHHSSTLL
jgi:hypothetical protein